MLGPTGIVSIIDSPSSVLIVIFLLLSSALSIEMALGIKPPPLGIVVRNLLLSCEYLYDNPLHLFVLAGPDYSEQLVKETNPEIWDKATRTS